MNSVSEIENEKGHDNNLVNHTVDKQLEAHYWKEKSSNTTLYNNNNNNDHTNIIKQSSTLNELVNDAKESDIELDKDELRRLTIKRDFRILPLVCLFYLFSFIDRVNIGNAKLAGLVEDINMTENEFNGALSIFFAGYIIFEIPANMVLNKIGPKIWISILLITWGSIMMAMAAVKNSTQIFVARFFLGVAEAGLVPAILFYMSIWYTKQEQARRIAIFFAVSTCAGAFGGVLAYGLMQLDGVQGLGGWQWIFIIEAIPTLVLAIISYIFLPDYPETTSFLTETERKIFMNMMAIDHGPTSEADSNFSWPQFFAVFKDWKTYAFSMIALCDIVCIYSISMFLPTIIHGMGFTALSAQGMSSFPYLVACIFTILSGISADKRKERGFHVMIPMLVAILGYIFLIALKDQGVPGLYFATILVTTGMYAAYASFASWFTNNIAGRTKRSVAVALITSIGNVGGCIAGQLYRTSDAPHYVHGHAASLGFMVIGVIFTLTLKFLFIHINKKRDNMTHEERYVIISKSTSIDLCDKHPDFRYIS